jgi:hypothetical protein
VATFIDILRSLALPFRDEVTAVHLKFFHCPAFPEAESADAATVKGISLNWDPNPAVA